MFFGQKEGSTVQEGIIRKKEVHIWVSLYIKIIRIIT